MDNPKISHHTNAAITDVVVYLEKIYGTLKVSRGDRHQYLGMALDYSAHGKVEVSMKQFTKTILTEFPDPLDKVAESTAGESLFHLKDTDDPRRHPLTEDRAHNFHRTVVQLLFLVTQPRRDCRTAFTFLTTQVLDPDKDDWGKLRRVICYFKQNPFLLLILEVDNLSIIHWHVDTSFTVHEDT